METFAVCIRSRAQRNERTSRPTDDNVCADATPLSFSPHGSFLESAGFDRVFGPNTTTAEIFESEGTRIMHAIVEGFHASVICYGASGSGKSYTLFGSLCDGQSDSHASDSHESNIQSSPDLEPSSSPDLKPSSAPQDTQGVTPHSKGFAELILADLLQQVVAPSRGGARLFISCVEILLENARDALSADKTLLKMQENAKGEVVLSNLSRHPVESVKQMKVLLQKLQSSQIHHSIPTSISPSVLHDSQTTITASGSLTSGSGSGSASYHQQQQGTSIHRGHIILQIILEQSQNDGIRSSRGTRVTRLNLVDLVGIDRGSIASGDETRIKESSLVNKGFLTLGNVIAKLSELGSTYVPFRDSKLTRFLQPYMNGSAKMLMICCIDPSPEAADETTSTLKFAARAKKIKIKPKRQAFIPEVKSSAAIAQSTANPNKDKKEISNVIRPVSAPPKLKFNSSLETKPLQVKSPREAVRPSPKTTNHSLNIQTTSASTKTATSASVSKLVSPKKTAVPSAVPPTRPRATVGSALSTTTPRSDRPSTSRSATGQSKSVSLQQAVSKDQGSGRKVGGSGGAPTGRSTSSASLTKPLAKAGSVQMKQDMTNELEDLKAKNEQLTKELHQLSIRHAISAAAEQQELEDSLMEKIAENTRLMEEIRDLRDKLEEFHDSPKHTESPKKLSHMNEANHYGYEPSSDFGDEDGSQYIDQDEGSRTDYEQYTDNEPDTDRESNFHEHHPVDSESESNRYLEYEQELILANERILELSTTLEEKSQNLEDCRARNEVLEKQSQDYLQRISDLERKIEALESEALGAALSSEKETPIDDLTMNSNAFGEKEAMKTRLQELEAENAELKADLAHKETQIELILDMQQTAYMGGPESGDDIQELQDQLAEIKREKSKLQDLNEDLRFKLSTKDKQLSDYVSKFKVSSERFKEMEKDWESKESTYLARIDELVANPPTNPSMDAAI
eukprot:TRINITY_DN8732_c0_g1_i1.p1 TRINITY_DN8732_c0_g1~~TRINITY_DN8732_c0_g1_i1.p1  ORF type:complete len:967 (+),score=243.80 TRINITY_DN8732_c0_g1_i1:48-2948(+)